MAAYIGPMPVVHVCICCREAPDKERDTVYTVVVHTNDGSGFEKIQPCSTCIFTVSKMISSQQKEDDITPRGLLN